MLVITQTKRREISMFAGESGEKAERIAPHRVKGGGR
jgi:hypothetical protein